MMSSEAEVNFYLLDVDASSDAIRLFGITPDGKKVLALDGGFEPYFYVIPKPDASLNALQETLAKLSVGLEAKAVSAKLIEKGRKVFKIVANKHIYVPALASAARKIFEVDDVLEADIRFYRRYLLDRQLTPCALVNVKGVRRTSEEGFDIEIDVGKITQVSTDITKNHKILAFDIETFCKGNVPNPETDSIIHVSFFGSGFQKIITWKRFSNAKEYVTFVSGELELLQEFAKIVQQQKPDMLVGYGSDSFDLPFIVARAQKYNIDLGLDITMSRQGRAEADIIGITHLDISHFIRNILNLETERYKLDIVAKEILGKGKLFNLPTARKISEIWSVGLDEELRALADYNLIDSQLAYELCLNILQTEFELVKLLGLPLRDINRMTYGALVEWYLIKSTVNKDILIPRKPTSFEIAARRKKTYSGAFVVEPKPGFYTNLCVFDFRSLYPSIIASHNISPETHCCDCCKWRQSGTPDESIWFCDNKTGFFPTLIKDLIDRRSRVKAILKQTSQDDAAFPELVARAHALKYVAASFYGYMGFPGSRWYNVACASAVTSLGRKYIQIVQKEAEKLGYPVIYGDTDSLFLQIGEYDESKVKAFVELVNSTLPSPMELEYRDFYPAGIFLEKKTAIGGGAKKRYALLTRNRRLLLRGLEAIRGDWSGLAKSVQRKVLELVLTDGNVLRALAHVQQLVSKVRDRKVDLSELIIEVRLTKALGAYSARGPHVAAGELYAARGEQVGRGYRVKFIVKTGSGKVSDRVGLPEDVKIDEYDADYYINHQVIRPITKIFELFNISEEKLKGGQTTLG